MAGKLTPQPDKQKHRTSIELDQSTRQQIEDYCGDNKITFRELVLRALNQYLPKS